MHNIEYIDKVVYQQKYMHVWETAHRNWHLGKKISLISSEIVYEMVNRLFSYYIEIDGSLLC